MENRKVTPMWNENASRNSGPLRRPNISSLSSVLTNGASSNESSSANVPTANLSPANVNTKSTSSDNTSDILSKSKLSADAKEWYPPSYNKNDSAGSSLPEYESNEIEQLKQFLEIIKTDPGRFEFKLVSCIESMEPFYDDVEFVLNMTKLIVDHALEDDRYSFNAAKLSIAIEEQCPLFRTHLYTLCDKKLKENKFDLKLIMFMAELYDKQQYENLYGKFVMQALKNVVTLKDEYSIKTLCQVILLCGKSLSQFYKEEIDKVIDQLVQKTQKENLPQNLIKYMNKVFQLQDSNWNYDSIECPTMPISERLKKYTFEPIIEPIYYGADGEAMTAAQRDFLYGDDSDSSYELDPELDEEMQKAFRDFVRYGK